MEQGGGPLVSSPYDLPVFSPSVSRLTMLRLTMLRLTKRYAHQLKKPY
ncbi:hypothetical protein PCIT_a3803 [Pseudoalteromonas citrea]|uniref:Uncharacterized protein n=1 Tax=Pseudoalteromonas citrea TaxID=43655 RepID=A0AAD4AGA1_9GAMM|nr:hypothetical protein PCIT_a3803 [Pseudoalteromonas citrea]